MRANINVTASKETGLRSARPLVQGEDWSGYGQAVLHLAWLQEGGRAGHLLFGMVELRPSEFPITGSSEAQSLRTKDDVAATLHYRRFALSVADAVGWYQHSMDGDVRLPVDHDDNPAGDRGVPLHERPFAGWPAWPTLAASNELDFAPDWMQGSRAHFLHPRTPLPASALATIRSEVNRSQLEKWLHFDLVNLYSDYLGAICLLAPNPLFRSIEESHLNSPTEGFAETVAYKLVARANQSVEGTRLEIINEGLRGRPTPVPVDFGNDPVQVLDFANLIDKEGRIATHPHHGLLAWSEPTPLIRSVHVGLDVVARQKTVEVPPGGRKKPAYEYNVHELEEGGDAVIGMVSDHRASEATALSAMHRRAKKRTEGTERWFQDAPEDAAQFIRCLIGHARRIVLIADPYFAGRELLAFGHATRRSDVQLRVLTSNLALKTHRPARSSCLLRGLTSKLVSKGKTDTDAATVLRKAIDSFGTYPTKPAIRVLGGKQPRLHDRFFVVDETVWFSGNSLNSIGERAAMIVRLRHPEPVVARLEGMWQAATPFTDWIAGLPDDA